MQALSARSALVARPVAARAATRASANRCVLGVSSSGTVISDALPHPSVSAVNVVARDSAWFPGTKAPEHLSGSLVGDFGACAPDSWTEPRPDARGGCDLRTVARLGCQR